MYTYVIGETTIVLSLCMCMYVCTCGYSLNWTVFICSIVWCSSQKLRVTVLLYRMWSAVYGLRRYFQCFLPGRNLVQLQLEEFRGSEDHRSHMYLVRLTLLQLETVQSQLVNDILCSLQLCI